MNEQLYLEAARYLLAAELHRSALALLDRTALGGHRVNRLRRTARARVDRHELRPGFYALTVVEGFGIPIPFDVEPGIVSSPALDERAADAFARAVELIQRQLGASAALPRLAVTVSSHLAIAGRSLGLVSALAAAARYSGFRPRHAVLATGEIDSSGRVLPVDGIEAKLTAARREAEGSDALVLIPAGQDVALEEVTTERAGIDADRSRFPLSPSTRGFGGGRHETLPSSRRPEMTSPTPPRRGGERDHNWSYSVLRVATLEEALRIVFGDVPSRVDSAFTSFQRMLDESRDEPDHDRAIRLLEAIPVDSLAPTDRAALWLEQGCRTRHTGDTNAAHVLHTEALAAAEEGLGGGCRAFFEKLELETMRTRMDRFEFDVVEEWLREQIAGDFHDPHNGVRCRGMLAELLSTTGRHAEVVALREENLSIQRHAEVMRREIPRTLACMVYEAARADDEVAFDSCALELKEATTPGDISQQRYNDAALFRGLGLLERHAAIVDWFDRKPATETTQPSGMLLEELRTRESIMTHPEITSSRYVARALRKRGRLDASRVVAEKIGRQDLPPRALFLALLGQVELALTLVALGLEAEARSTASQLADALPRIAPRAAAFHAELIERLSRGDLDPEIIEPLLDWEYF
jgi:hypothetical protein